MDPSAADAADGEFDYSDPSNTTQLLMVRNLYFWSTRIRRRRVVVDELLGGHVNMGHGGDAHLLHSGQQRPPEAAVGELGLTRHSAALLRYQSEQRTASIADAWNLASLIISLARDYTDTALFDELVDTFINVASRSTIPVHTLIVLCRLVGAAANRNHQLYVSCRSKLAAALSKQSWLDQYRGGWTVEEVVPFFREMVETVTDQIVSGCSSGRPARSVMNLTELIHFCGVLQHNVCAGLMMPVAGGHAAGESSHQSSCQWKTDVSEMMSSLLKIVDDCMERYEAKLRRRGITPLSSVTPSYLAWMHSVLTALRVINSLSEIKTTSAVGTLRATLVSRGVAVDALVRSVGRNGGRQVRWLVRHKDILTFTTRKHLAVSTLPERSLDDDEHISHPEMVIRRSWLVDDSFVFLSETSPDVFRRGLSVEFEHEDAFGEGVLREWLCLVCQALFTQHRSLFSACPHDKRRFFLNPAPVMDRTHLKYCKFAGQIVGLALMHEIQVGVFFDKTLFLQLAGEPVTLDDIADADPFFHQSCVKILEMDPDVVDSDALGLTFVRQVEAPGSRVRKITELIPGGMDIVVNSKNRSKYIALLVQDQFVNSTNDSLTHFAEGFGSMLIKENYRIDFFQSLVLEDFDMMLGGSHSAIDVEDWKSSTVYCHYKRTDPQIIWFWQAVERMTNEQRMNLLFFWTSVQYLPYDGFSGLGKMLCISWAALRGNPDHLPSSRTCCHCLYLPEYTSLEMTEQRLQIIAHEYVSRSFGRF
ncbi:hypothetical protein GUJ93_ZPchr0008g12061 [Zizania palustris]|uniref:HECT domain-containing protein n=1 Tax=Zizania palustris TaxID=103762 RepID=A0A8J5REP2_ZIZPA|nr:hypothetical protein GUJ93_ZPchr0008g12061 [Zizania palustris]